MQSSDNLVWLDLEMTGLEVESCRIIEMAAIITDKNLNVIAESQPIAIHQPTDVIKSMNSWCIKTHGESGLTQRVIDSQILETEAEQMMLDFVQTYVPENTSPLCGNSIWQDRKFLAKYMPTLESYFHYRMIDVSTVKLLASYWKPKAAASFNKSNTHLALDDIRESIAELKHYRKHFLICDQDKNQNQEGS